MKRNAGVPSLAILVLGLAAADPAAAQSAPGPGIGQRTYTDAELFKRLAPLPMSSPMDFGASTVHRGYFVNTIDAVGKDAGLQAWDLSDPRSPVLVHRKLDAESRQLIEFHALSFVRRDGRFFFAGTEANDAIQIWEWTDIRSPRRISRLNVGSGKNGAYSGIAMVVWQGNTIFCAGTTNGIYVVDAADPAHPRLVKRVANTFFGNHMVGEVYPLGNLLVVSSIANDANTPSGAYAAFDIGNPADPVLLDTLTSRPNYFSFFSGTRIYAAGLDLKLHVLDVSNPNALKLLSSSPTTARGSYGMFQDGFAHVGMSNYYAKFDVRGAAPVVVGKFDVGVDNDWAVPLGNLAFVGDDDGPGGALVPHQKTPDLAGPGVNAVNPRDGATGQALSSRVGVSFTDGIDLDSVTSATLIVRPEGGAALPGHYSSLHGLVNFTPLQPLQPGTRYEIVIPKGGIRDWSRNPIGAEFRSSFTTAGTAPPSPPLAPSALTAKAVSDSRIDLAWTDNSSNEAGFKVERSTGGSFTQVATVGANVKTWSDTGRTASTTYAYRVRAHNSAGNSAYSNTASATTLSGGTGAALSPPWKTEDVGTVGAAGKASHAAGAFTLDGSGADIWGTADEFRFVHQTLRGDGSIIARLASQENTHEWAKAGPMLRKSLAADSPHALLAATPSRGAALWRRTAAAGTTAGTARAGIAAPTWLRLSRSGEALAGYVSSDGLSWTRIDQATVSLGTDVLVGLAVTSHDDGVLCTAVFDSVMVIAGTDADGDGLEDGTDADASSPDVDGNGVSDGLDDWDGDGTLNHADATAGSPPAGVSAGSDEGGSGAGSCGALGLEAALLWLLVGFCRRFL